MKIKLPFSKFKKPKTLVEGCASISHIHSWKLVGVTDQFYTRYTDTAEIVHWNLRLYKCAYGARDYKCDKPEIKTHKGLYQAILNWEELGIAPENIKMPAGKKL